MAAAKGVAAREMIPEKALIMSGFGINSEMETQEVLARAGMAADIVHINDLIAGRNRLSDYRLLVFPGGFSYGDDTGAGNAYANRYATTSGKIWRNFSTATTSCWGSATGSRSWQISGLSRHLTRSTDAKSP